MNRGIRNVVDDRNQGQGDLARPVFQQGEIENHGIWIELVPHLVKMIIVDSGNGGTPVAGDFIRVKQYIYLENMTLVKGERATLLFGKGHLLPGLEICLAICREGFKARCFLAPNYAYGAEKAGKIPANSCLIIDIEVATITKEPVLRESEDDNLLVGEIVSLEREGLNFFRKGDSVEAQLRFESAFARIQSTRSKEIKNYLYSNTKSQYFNNEQIPSLEKKKDQQYLVQLYKKFDSIKVRTVQLALLNKDYYKVLILSKQCLMESRLEINDTILMARSKAFAAVGQFDEAVKLAEHLKSKHPEDLHLKEELEKIYKREDMFLDMLDQMDEDFDEPILNLFPVNLNIKKEKKKVPKKLQSQKFKKQEV